MRKPHHDPATHLHWRGALRGGFVRTNFSLCGAREDTGIEFTSRARLITCPTCRRLKTLRASVARQRLAGIEAGLAAARTPDRPALGQPGSDRGIR